MLLHTSKILSRVASVHISLIPLYRTPLCNVDGDEPDGESMANRGR